MRLPPFEIERYFAPWEFTVPYMLSGSDCESMSVAELCGLVPGARERLDELWLGYTETRGSPALREAIAGRYERVRPHDVVVHNGAGEAIFTLVTSLLGPGDHAIVHYPCYQSLFQVAEGLGADVTRWRVRPEEGWRLDLDLLEDSIEPRTKLVAVNSPHNPTGTLIDRSTFDRLIEICRKHGLVLLSDEVYRGLEHDPSERLPAACERYERAASIGVLSKTYGLPGLRIGWLATRDPELLEGALRVKDYTTLCSSAPSERLAEIAFEALDAIVDRNRSIVLENKERLAGFLERHASRLSWVEPRAGAIGFPQLAAGDPDEFCRRVRQEADVLLLPGTVYDRDSRGIRIGFGRRNMREGLARLDDWLSAR